MLTNAIVLALAATGVTATYKQAIQLPAQAAKRELHIAARQTQTDDDSGDIASATACYSSLTSIFSSLPTAPADVLDWESTATITDACSFTFPTSLSSAISSFESEVESWYSKYSADIDSALSQCPKYSSIVGTGLGGGYGDSPICTTDDSGGAGGVGGSGSGRTTTTTDDDDDEPATTSTSSTRGAGGAGGAATTTTSSRTTATTSPTSSRSGTSATSAAATAKPSGNAGSRKTGFVAGVVAVAGFLGAVAAL
jgi:hypothetical protein